MRYALVPGEVYLRDPNHLRVTLFPLKSPSAFRLLATCKQIYEEGIRIYYNDNTFYLPRGGSERSKAFLYKVLGPKHRHMIRNLGIVFSLRDCPDYEHDEMLSRFANIPPTTAEFAQELWNVWRDKVELMVRWYSVEADPAASLYVRQLVPARQRCPDPSSYTACSGQPRNCTVPLLLFDELAGSRVLARDLMLSFLPYFDMRTVMKMLMV